MINIKSCVSARQQFFYFYYIIDIFKKHTKSTYYSVIAQLSSSNSVFDEVILRN